MKIGWFALALFVLTTTAFAHSWYPANCCSDHDCRPVACEELVSNADGTMEWDGLVFKRVFPSQDAKCHVCFYEGGENNTRIPYCAFQVMTGELRQFDAIPLPSLAGYLRSGIGAGA